MPKFGPPPTRTRRHSAAQARSLQQLQASARAALSSAGMVDWPLPIRALSLLFCIGAILADLVIVGFTGTWLVDAAVYRYNHAIGASGLSYNMTFSVLNTSIEWDLALPPIRNGSAALAGSIDGLEEGGAADLGSFVLHAYALVLLGLLAMANARHRKAPHYFHSPGKRTAQSLRDSAQFSDGSSITSRLPLLCRDRPRPLPLGLRPRAAPRARVARGHLPRHLPPQLALLAPLRRRLRARRRRRPPPRGLLLRRRGAALRRQVPGGPCGRGRRGEEHALSSCTYKCPSHLIATSTSCCP